MDGPSTWRPSQPSQVFGGEIVHVQLRPSGCLVRLLDDERDVDEAGVVPAASRQSSRSPSVHLRPMRFTADTLLPPAAAAMSASARYGECLVPRKR